MKQPVTNRLMLILLLASLADGGWAQPVVSNIRVETDARRIRITYDLKGAIDQDSIYVQVESRTRGMLNPKTVTGDVGRHITSGINKVIYWDYALDGERITDEIRPTVGVIETKKAYTGPPVGGGPANALLSVLLPGAGNILVQPNHKIGIRPLITVAYGGLLAYGLVQKKRSDRQFANYTNEPFERDARPYYDLANRHHKNAVRGIRGAAVVLVADVMYSYIRGRHNSRQIRTFQQRITLNYSDRTPTVGMQWTF